MVFLDADTLVLRPIDRLFDYPEFSAAPNVYESVADFRRLNSGVFAARPDPATFAAMLARLDIPGAFWKRTDQTFLAGLLPRLAGPAGLRQPAAIRLAQPARALGLEA